MVIPPDGDYQRRQITFNEFHVILYADPAISGHFYLLTVQLGQQCLVKHPDPAFLYDHQNIRWIDLVKIIPGGR